MQKINKDGEKCVFGNSTMKGMVQASLLENSKTVHAWRETLIFRFERRLMI